MMAFPDTRLDLRAELLVNGTWTDVTGDWDHGPCEIGRGHPDESTSVSPSTLNGLTLTNTTGKYTSRNPLSPLYPYLMRNVQCRVSIPAQLNYMRLEEDRVSYASTPTAAALQITGDIDIRLDMQLSSYVFSALADKSAGSQTSWLLEMNPDRTLRWFWWDSGGGLHLATSDAAIPYGRIAVRVTLAVATGTVTFYTAPNISGTYTQLGDAVVAGATSIFGGTAPLVVGDDASSPYGRIYGFQLRSGIGGTLVAYADFTSQAAGAASWTDPQGNTWTLNGTAEISSRDYRGHFEMPEWPQHQDPTGKTITVATQGGGLLRRLSQRNNPVRSAMYRAWTQVTGAILAAYWPMEDGANAASFGSGNGGQPMYFGGSALPQLAANSDFACSAALPVVNGSVFSGRVYSPLLAWTDNQVAFLMEVPGGGELNGAAVCAVTTTGTVAQLLLTYWTTSGGSLQLQGFDNTGTQVFNSLVITNLNVNGATLLAEISLQNAGGGNITWTYQQLAPGASSGLIASGTTSGTIGAVTRVQFNPYGSLGLTGTVLGHAAVLRQAQSLFALDAYQNPDGLWTGALNAWAGEPAGVRLARICAEEGIQFRARGVLDTTPLMGPQTQQTVQQLCQECADADRGIWYELRQQLGWGYITRSALYNQAAQVTVDYNQDHLGMWTADPLEDDQVIVNDATVSQTSGGSSARQYAAPGQPVTGGRLSTLSPPDGCGTYDQSYQVNLYSADDLANEASWIVHVGTVDQPRYPGICLDLANRDLASLFWNVVEAELGDRVVIANPGVAYGPDPVSQLAQQLTETLWYDTLTVAVCGVPEQPYEVAQDGAGFHVDTDGTTLNAGVSSTATSMSFATSSGFPLWTTSAGDFPFDVNIGGERVTVTNITGSSSPQAATVTRSVNGVIKSQSAGAAVALWNTPVIPL